MGCSQIIGEFFEYNTPHIVHIKSKKVGVFSRLVQLCIIGYIIGFVIVYKKGYQEFSDINSSVTTKLKGVAYPNFTDDQFQVPFPHAYKHIWDVADFVVPPQENGAFFVATNVIITPNQTQGICAEDSSLPNAVCDVKNNTCVANEPVTNGNGFMTGKCIPSWDNKTHVCEVRAWCPVEVNLLPLGVKTPLLGESQNFTVLIKNSIEFPLFGIRRRNVLNNSNSSYLSNCQYHPRDHPSCPVFRLGTIVDLAGEKFQPIAVQGGVIAIVIHWDCNLDFDPETYCTPSYSFRRLDDPYALIAKGWNFRYANYFENDVRTLYKAYGIRFVILVQGQGGKFNVVPLLLNIGSGLALLGISVIICDIIVLYLSKSKEYYYEKKFLQVNSKKRDENDEEEPILR